MQRSQLLFCVAESVVAIIVSASFAVGAGELDPTFGTEGKLAFTFSGSSGAMTSAIQPDGKIVVGGYGNGMSGFALARLTSGGSFDVSFGTAGKVQTSFGSFVRD